MNAAELAFIWGVVFGYLTVGAVVWAVMTAKPRVEADRDAVIRDMNTTVHWLALHREENLYESKDKLFGALYDSGFRRIK